MLPSSQWILTVTLMVEKVVTSCFSMLSVGCRPNSNYRTTELYRTQNYSTTELKLQNYRTQVQNFRTQSTELQNSKYRTTELKTTELPELQNYRTTELQNYRTSRTTELSSVVLDWVLEFQCFMNSPINGTMFTFYCHVTAIVYINTR